jgi:lipid II isoglutaminyl synthase (glutamine-hydrolysing)
MSEHVKDTGMVLKIGHLYPTLMSVAADRGNLFAIEKRCQWRGIATEVEQIFVKQTPDFTKYDLILFHGGADREMELASRDIQLKAPSLREASEANVVFLSVCAGFQLLGHYYKPFKGPELQGVGLLDFYTEGGGTRFMTHMALECEFKETGKMVLVGYENHSGRTYLGPHARPLGKVLVGWGNNGKDGYEGAIYKNVFGTYLHGPILPKNPQFTDFLIQRALERRYGKVELAPLDNSTEQAAHDAAFRLAMEFKGTMSAIDATPWKR